MRGELHGAITVLGVIAALATADTAFAGSIYEWSFQEGDPGNYVYSDRGGAVNMAHSVYDTNTGRLRWEANFGPPSANPGRQTGGFTLAMNSGGDPVGTQGELAMLFFDATGVSPILSVYAYNGTSLNDSWRDGSNAGGVQPPDRIVSSLNDSSFIFDIFVQEEIDGSRTMGFEIDTTAINAHDPLYGSVDDWTGIQFAQELGIWLHPYAELSTSYGENGFLSDWDYLFENRGYLDANNFSTVLIPLPRSLLLGLAGLVLVILGHLGGGMLMRR